MANRFSKAPGLMLAAVVTCGLFSGCHGAPVGRPVFPQAPVFPSGGG